MTYANVLSCKNVMALAAVAAVTTCSQRTMTQGFQATRPLLQRKTFSTSLSAVNRLQQQSSLRNKYYALRHGQSKANVQGIIASNPDIACSQYGLSQLGIQQAQTAGMDVVRCFLNQKQLDGLCLLSSDLLRARQTAQAVADAVQQHNKNHPSSSGSFIPLYYNGDSTTTSDVVIFEKRLRERGFGEWDLQEDSNYQNVWKDDAIDPSHTHRGVESVDSVMNRVTECILDWDARLEHKMVVCVAHGDVLQILQTSFHKLNGSKHRTLEHLETATLRELELF